MNSPSPNCLIPIHSPTSPYYHTQHYSPSPTVSHSNQNFSNSSQITHPHSQNAVNVSENAVLYAEGPAGEILKELLVLINKIYILLTYIIFFKPL